MSGKPKGRPRTTKAELAKRLKRLERENARLRSVTERHIVGAVDTMRERLREEVGHEERARGARQTLSALLDCGLVSEPIASALRETLDGESGGMCVVLFDSRQIWPPREAHQPVTLRATRP